MWVLLPNAHATEKAVPLRRSHFYWGDETKDGSIAYCKVAMPHDPDVPVPLRGATTVVRFNSTDIEIHTNPHTRSLRPIPEADLDFEIFGAREDIESTFSDLKRRTRGRLRYLSEDRNRFNILSYMILRLSRTQSAYHERTTAAQAFPIAAERPPCGPQPAPEGAPGRTSAPERAPRPSDGPNRRLARPRIASPVHNDGMES